MFNLVNTTELKKRLIEKYWKPDRTIVVKFGNLEITIYPDKDVTIIENGDTLII